MGSGIERSSVSEYQTEVNIRERGGGRKRKPDWLVEEHGLEDGTKTPARIHLRSPSAILGGLAGRLVGRITEGLFGASAELRLPSAILARLGGRLGGPHLRSTDFRLGSNRSVRTRAANTVGTSY